MSTRPPHDATHELPRVERRRRRSRSVVAIAALAAAAAVAAALVPLPLREPAEERPGSRLQLGRGLGSEGFARAIEPRPFQLPKDHGAHLEFQTEWWYYTGNLASATGARYGFQLTFFRRGLSPGAPVATGGLATNQVYFAHLALTDVMQGDHVFAERFARGAAGLAGATGQPFSVWLEDWEAVALEADGSAVRLAAHDEASGLFLELELRARKPLVAHGDRGLSPKSDEPGNASYYVGYTRLAATGRVGIGERQSEVSGEAWFDHEWSTSALGAGAVGWDWFSLQLDDGRELMHFRIRREDGSVEPASSGTLVAADGTTRRLTREEVEVEPLRHWTSPHSRVRYPVAWRLRVPSERLSLRIEPWLDDQEMRTSFLYWEGAVRVTGTAGETPVAGVGYVELTGYGRSMQGVF